MRPQYRTANQLKSDTAPIAFMVARRVFVRVHGQRRDRQSCLEEQRVCAGDAEKGHFRPPDGAAQIQVRLHDQEQRPGDGVDQESADRPRHQRLHVADGKASEQPDQPQVEKARAANQHAQADEVQRLGQLATARRSRTAFSRSRSTPPRQRIQASFGVRFTSNRPSAGRRRWRRSTSPRDAAARERVWTVADLRRARARRSPGASPRTPTASATAMLAIFT